MTGKVRSMEKEVESWIKTRIGEWIAADGLESVIKLEFQDTEFSDVTDFVYETVLKAYDGDEIAVKSIFEIKGVHDLLMRISMETAQKTFREVMTELKLVHDTMLAGITRALT